MNYNLGYAVSRLLFVGWIKVFHSLKVFGRENLPKRGPFICAANHTSYGDPPLVGVACNTAQLIFMAKEELFRDKYWGWWFKILDCVPISRDKKDYRATKEALKRLKKGKSIGIFPEGKRSRLAQIVEPEPGAGFLALKADVPVIPFFISGAEKALPVGGRYKIWTPVKVYIGKQVDFEGIEKIRDKREKYHFVSERIMEAITRLKWKSSSPSAQAFASA